MGCQSTCTIMEIIAQQWWTHPEALKAEHHEWFSLTKLLLSNLIDLVCTLVDGKEMVFMWRLLLIDRGRHRYWSC